MDRRRHRRAHDLARSSWSLAGIRRSIDAGKRVLRRRASPTPIPAGCRSRGGRRINSTTSSSAVTATTTLGSPGPPIRVWAQAVPGPRTPCDGPTACGGGGVPAPAVAGHPDVARPDGHGHDPAEIVERHSGGFMVFGRALAERASRAGRPSDQRDHVQHGHPRRVDRSYPLVAELGVGIVAQGTRFHASRPTPCEPGTREAYRKLLDQAPIVGGELELSQIGRVLRCGCRERRTRSQAGRHPKSPARGDIFAVGVRCRTLAIPTRCCGWAHGRRTRAWRRCRATGIARRAAPFAGAASPAHRPGQRRRGHLRWRALGRRSGSLTLHGGLRARDGPSGGSPLAAMGRAGPFGASESLQSSERSLLRRGTRGRLPGAARRAEG